MANKLRLSYVCSDTRQSPENNSIIVFSKYFTPDYFNPTFGTKKVHVPVKHEFNINFPCLNKLKEVVTDIKV